MRALLALALLLPLIAHGEDERDRFVREGVTFSIVVRTPEQMKAFYSARGFPEDMVDAVAQTCLVGVGILNRRSDTVWLELDNWRFTDADGREVKRITRPEWDARWEAMNAPHRSRSTFDWTQLPESRDLQPDEPVGGNVAVHAPAGEFTLSARFRTGSDKVIGIEVPHLRCVREGAAP